MAVTLKDIMYAENFLAQGDLATALPLLERLCEEAEERIANEFQTTDEVQYFSFADTFERLAYKRVEDDPRELVQVDVPYDRLYADLAFAYVRSGDLERARAALMQAARWDPMNCAYRLDLAEVFRALGDAHEWAALSHSVIERAADARLLAGAYANMGMYFLEAGNSLAAAGCARRALELGPREQRVMRLAQAISERDAAWDEVPDAEAAAEMERQGVPASPNAEIAICLVMCATDAAAEGDADEATRLTLRARDLVGADAAKALVALVRESDAELERERDAAGEGDHADQA